MRCAWLSDIHLNFLDKPQRMAFYATLEGVDAVLISGDIAEATNIEALLKEMYVFIGSKPIMYVAGNHDYYDGRVEDVRELMYQLSQESSQQIGWLGATCTYVTIGKTLITGVDGWGDMRNGNKDTYVQLNDENYIQNLRDARMCGQKAGFSRKRQELADADALNLYYKTSKALKENAAINTCVVLTHVPPYEDSAKFKGRRTGEDFLPYYTCRATGDALDKLAIEFPNVRFRVFCGHTHEEAYYKPHKNMIVRTASAQYYAPKIQQIVRI